MDALQVLLLIGTIALAIALGLVALALVLAILLPPIALACYGAMHAVFWVVPAPEFVRFLAWRYLRRRLTNWIGIAGLFVAVGALILILSIMTGFLEQSRAAVRGSLSDLVILPKDGGTFDFPHDPAPLLERVRADPRVEAASAHLVWLCILTQENELSVRVLSSSQSGQYAGVKLTGVDPDDEAATTEFRASLVRETQVGALVEDPSRPFAPPPEAGLALGRPRASVIVGEQLFDRFHLQRGSRVTFMTAVPDPDPRSRAGWSTASREFVVAGTFRSRENEMDLERIYVERDQLARFLAGLDEDQPLPAGALQYSEVLVKLKDYERDARTARSDLHRDLVVAGLLPPYSDVLTWEDFRGTLLGAIENERTLMAIMLSLVLLVAGFTVFAILSMMVTEKRRDIGILTALGATPRGVLAMFLLIGFWDALLGASAGAALGTWAAVEIDAIERWLSGSFSRSLSAMLDRPVVIEIFDRDVYLFEFIPSVVTPLAVSLIVLGAFVCTLVFAALPAWRAAKLDPLEALRYE